MKNSPGHRRVPSDVQMPSHSLVGQATNSETKPDMLADLADHIGSRRTSALPSEPMEDTVMKSIAIEGFLKELGLKEGDRPFIEDNIVLKEVAPGTTLTHQGRSDVSCLSEKIKILEVIKHTLLFRMYSSFMLLAAD